MAEAAAAILANTQALVRAVAAQLPYVAAALATFGVFWLAAAGVRRVVRLGGRRLDPSLAQMLSGLAYGGTVVAGVLTAVWIGVPTVRFADIFTSLGVTGIILGFALRDILENFVAGILILWRRPFHAGDQIRSGQHEGTVEEVNFRATVLRTYDGVRVFVPNGRVLTEPVENFTAHLQRRSTVVLGIDQGASVAKAREIVVAALREVAGVLLEPPPAVFFESVGDFANVLHVVYWTAPPNRLSERSTHSDVTERLYGALQEAGIGFPYPIRTVQLDPETTLRAPDAANSA